MSDEDAAPPQSESPRAKTEIQTEVAPGKRLWTRTWQRIVLSSFVGGAKLLRRLPRRGALRFGAGLGSLGYHIDRRRRHYADRNLRLAFGGTMSAADRRALIRDVFRHWGKSTIEFVRTPVLDAGQLNQLVTAVEGREHLESVRAAGTGFIIVSGHLGNFEFMGRWLAAQGVPSTAVVRAPADPGLAEYLQQIREFGGNRMLPKGTTTARDLLAVLRRKQVLTIGIDQNSGDVFVPFFGVPAGTAFGPALLALRTGVPLLPTFCVLEPDDSYRMIFLPPIRPQATGDKDADILRAMTEATEALDATVRRFPDQWLWLHNRWKSAFEEKNRSRWPAGYDFDAAWVRWTAADTNDRPDAGSPGAAARLES